MRIIQGNNETVAIDSLKPHPRNPRQGDIGAIHESINNNGFYGSVLAQRSTGFILAGNHRWQAMLQAGAKEIPVTWIDVDDDHALRILLADNRTNDMASYNEEELANILEQLIQDTGTLAGTGYDGDALDELLEDLGREAAPTEEAPEAQVDRADELQKKWGTKLGQLWQIGSHRVVCGDSSEKKSYDKLLNGETVEMVWTDPPYGVSYQTNMTPEQAKKLRRRTDGLTVANDELSNEDLQSLLSSAFNLASASTRKGGAWYVAAPPGPKLRAFANVLDDLGIWRQSLAWVKDRLVLGRSDYHGRHEIIFYGWVPGGSHYFIDDRTQDSVIEVARPAKSELHPTMKPIDLITKAIKNSSKPSHKVLDPFAGSGSTLVAAAMTDRQGFGIELDPKYVAVILERLSEMNLTPELVEKS